MSHNRFTSRVVRLLVLAFTMVLGITLITPANPASAEPVYLPDGSKQSLNIGFMWDSRTDQLYVYNFEPFPVTFSHTDSTYGAQSVVVQQATNAPAMCMDVSLTPEMKVSVAYVSSTGSQVTGYGYAGYVGSAMDIESAQRKVDEAKGMLNEAKADFRVERKRFKKAQRRLVYVKRHHFSAPVIRRAIVKKSKAQRKMLAARRYRDRKAEKLAYEQDLLTLMHEAYAYCPSRRTDN